MMEKHKVAFEAQVMQNNIKSLRTMDKQGWIKLEYRAEDDDLVNDINRLHKADMTVMVVLIEKEDTGGL